MRRFRQPETKKSAWTQIQAANEVELWKWCRRRESNPRPSRYECAALPTELHRHGVRYHIHKRDVRQVRISR